MACKLETPAGGAPELVGLYEMLVNVILFQRSRCGMAIEVGSVELPPVAIRRADEGEILRWAMRTGRLNRS